MICEMCGKDVSGLTPTRVEGTILQLCADCAKFGQAVVRVGPAIPAAHGADEVYLEPQRAAVYRPRRSTEERDVFADMPEMELSPDWYRRIRQAREHLGWTPEEFGKRLNEKKSLVLKVEAGSFRPSDAILKKIERLLKIRLTVDPNAAAP